MSPPTSRPALDWDDEDLWDQLDQAHTVRGYEPVLRTFLDYLISIGWRPPEESS